MSILSDAIAAETAVQARLVPVQVEPFEYGTDLSCVSDLTPRLDEVDPNSVQGMGESIVRFLTSERDSIPDAPGRGWNIYRLLAANLSPSGIANAQRAIESEITQDDRYDNAVATVSYVGKTAIINVRVTPVDLALGPFDLIVAVPEDGTILYELMRAAA